MPNVPMNQCSKLINFKEDDKLTLEAKISNMLPPLMGRQDQLPYLEAFMHML